ncbi:MAG: type IV secretory system conjugative DNA transfer family protein, partial [Burkholderiaceae bacterium]
MRKYPFLFSFLLCALLSVLTLQIGTAYLSSTYGASGISAPWSGFRWVMTQTPPTPTFLTWLGIQGAGFVIAFTMFAVSFKRLRRNVPIKDMHGTGRFATLPEIQRASLLGIHGVFVGGMEHKNEMQYLRHDGPEHILMVAPTRSGKGVSIVIPSLLTWGESAFVIDVKGELWALTSGWRQKVAKQTCFRFDPTDVNSARFNPLDTIVVGSANEIGDIQNIATLLADPEGKGMEVVDGHWKKAAHALLTGLICYAVHLAHKHERRATLADIGELLAPANSTFHRVVKAMSKFVPRNPRKEADAVTLIHSAARQQLSRAGEEAASVLSTTTNYVSLYRDPVLARCTSASDFTADDLMNADNPVTVYFVMNPADKARLQPATRLIISTIIRSLTKGMQYTEGKAESSHKRRLLLMMDEFAALGPLEAIADTLAYMASFGIKACLIVQDYAQLWALYTRNEKITGNCHVQIALAPNRVDTAQKISEMTGTTTVVKKEKLHQTSISLMSPHDDRYSEVSRPLLTPDEVMRLRPARKDGDNIVSAAEMLVFVGGMHPIRGAQPLYFQDKALNERAKLDPATIPQQVVPAIPLFDVRNPVKPVVDEMLLASTAAMARRPETDLVVGDALSNDQDIA